MSSNQSSIHRASKFLGKSEIILCDSPTTLRTLKVVLVVVVAFEFPAPSGRRRRPNIIRNISSRKK